MTTFECSADFWRCLSSMRHIKNTQTVWEIFSAC